MSVKHWTGIGARVNFENGNCYIAKATGEISQKSHKIWCPPQPKPGAEAPPPPW